MSDTLTLLLQNFDIKKMKGFCNVSDCMAKPSKIALFREFHLKKQVVRDLGKFYICEHHINKAQSLLKALNAITMKDGKVVRLEVKEGW